MTTNLSYNIPRKHYEPRYPLQDVMINHDYDKLQAQMCSWDRVSHKLATIVLSMVIGAVIALALATALVA